MEKKCPDCEVPMGLDVLAGIWYCCENHCWHGPILATSAELVTYHLLKSK